MRKAGTLFHGLVILILVLATLDDATAIAHAGNGNEDLKADPRLLQMAEENPDAALLLPFLSLHHFEANEPL